ncbi:hypothetical protein [Streptomyces acidiscabies]|uniref:Uncharacterized protein n=1 Tax=Streptomyces acidiscabies TaxID=42234 RepID=A0ABU4LW05_9ACTN|nr:hypothetical protein [Streptomyces acidiscabies]MDX3019916.1 hypothetical protein [Streptomyces acidiscabies]
MSDRIDGPFPISVRATDKGAELDVSEFLIRAVLCELVTQAAEDPHGVGEELAAIGDLLKSAIHQGPDSHARHTYDEQMQHLVDRYADGGSIPLYRQAVGQLRDACARIAAPRPVPSQRKAGAA